MLPSPGEEPVHEVRDADVRLPEPPHAAAVRRRRRPAGPCPQLRAAGRAHRRVRPLLHLLHAVHAGAARPAHRQAELSAPELGADRTVRRLGAGLPARERGLHAPVVRPLPLLGRGRRQLPRPLPELGVLPRAGGRSVDRHGHPAAGRQRPGPECLRGPDAGAGSRQPPVHAHYRGAAAVADGRRRHRLHAPQPRRRQLVPAHGDLRPARAVLQQPRVQGPLRRSLRGVAREERTAVRLAALRLRDRGRRAGRPHAPRVRVPGVDVRRTPGRRAGHHGRAVAVGRHDAHRLDRPRLPARRARVLGQGMGAVLRGGVAHAVLRVGPARRGAR